MKYSGIDKIIPIVWLEIRINIETAKTVISAIIIDPSVNKLILLNVYFNSVLVYVLCKL
jgi:hypothetical protein